jgi:Major intrinsic protein
MVKTQPSQHDGAVVVTLRSPATAVKAELALPDARRALAGEFLGCLLFIVFGAGTVAVTGGLLGEKLTSARLLAIALVHGLAFALLVSAMRRVSGGHLNPAVTFAALIQAPDRPHEGRTLCSVPVLRRRRRRTSVDAHHPIPSAGQSGSP